MRPLLVGESNPHSADPRHALYPHPPGCAGHRLMNILGLRRWEYMLLFDRANLLGCSPVWFPRAARERAAELLASDRKLILLGAKVAAAFGFCDGPFRSYDGRVLVLPHPSGRCRVWNDPGAAARAREAVARLVADADPARTLPRAWEAVLGRPARSGT